MNENSSADVLMEVFAGLLFNIYHYRGKILLGGNDEDLHQLRIACRKTVVLMGEFRLLYEGEELSKHRSRVKDIITISNDKRDMDVLNIELYRIEKDKEASWDQKALESLKKRVEKILQKEHETIITYLQSERCTKTLSVWDKYITSMNRTDISIYGILPIGSLSKYVIFQRFLKIKKHIKKLEHKQDIGEALHKLRIEYKKMRYLLENFGYLYEKKDIKKLLKEMKELQNVLGEFHDSHQQKMIYEWLLKTEENERVHVFIKEVLLSTLKIYQKKEILEIQKLLKEFLTKEQAYRKLFS